MTDPNVWYVKTYRNSDVRRLRKVVIEIYVGSESEPSQMIDRSRMFAGLGFARRLRRKIRRAIARANVMQAGGQ